MSHIIGVHCKIKLTVKRWKGWLAVLSPLERYSSCRSYRWCNSCCLGLSLHRRTDNFDCKLASRWFLVGFVANSIDRILLKSRQSVFLLIVGFVCSVIVPFCCCFFTSSVFSWQRLPSLCRCSPWSWLSRSCGVLFVNQSQRGSVPATCWIHCCWVCCSLLFAWDIGWWFTDSKHCYN